MMSDQADQMVYFTGTLDLDNTVQVESRVDEGAMGLWLVSSATVEGAPDDYHIPVVWGWIPEQLEADPTEITELFETSTESQPMNPSNLMGA